MWTYKCLPTTTVHVCLNQLGHYVTFLAPTYPGGIGNQTETKRWCHDLRAVAIYANRQFCSTMMIAKDLTVNQYPSEGIHDFAP